MATRDDVSAEYSRQSAYANANAEEVTAFVGNAREQLPIFPTVISWHMSNWAWLTITIAGMEVVAILGVVALTKIERAFEVPRLRVRSKSSIRDFKLRVCHERFDLDRDLMVVRPGC